MHTILTDMETGNSNPNIQDATKTVLPASTFDGLEWPDYIVIGIYFLSVLAVGLYVSTNNF